MTPGLYDKNYSKEHPETRSQCSRTWNQKIRCAVLAILGDKCARCGFSDSRALQIDHVNGGGGREAKELGQGSTYYLRVITSVQKKENHYQLLCANCN